MTPDRIASAKAAIRRSLVLLEAVDRLLDPRWRHDTHSNHLMLAKAIQVLKDSKKPIHLQGPNAWEVANLRGADQSPTGTRHG